MSLCVIKDTWTCCLCLSPVWTVLCTMLHDSETWANVNWWNDRVLICWICGINPKKKVEVSSNELLGLEDLGIILLEKTALLVGPCWVLNWCYQQHPRYEDKRWEMAWRPPIISPVIMGGLHVRSVRIWCGHSWFFYLSKIVKMHQKLAKNVPIWIEGTSLFSFNIW